MANSSNPATGTIYIDTAGTLKANTVTLSIDCIVWYGGTGGDDLVLTDANDVPFLSIKGAANTPVVIPYPHPRKLTGLKCVTIDSGVCEVYLRQA